MYVCAAFRCIGKKLDGSGFTDVALESGLVGSGTIHGVLSGKNYSRAITYHKIVLESLERLLLQKFIETTGNSIPQKVNDLSSNLSKESLDECMQDQEILDYIVAYHHFREKVCSGDMGKTPRFWLSYMNHVWLILQLHEAVKRNDYELYLQCMFRLPDIFFAFDRRTMLDTQQCMQCFWQI
jgi:hypothetical protein